MRVLFVGDVVGRPGRQAIDRLLPSLIEQRAIDFCIVNAENAAGGAGITRAIADGCFNAGADVITSGNHVWAHREVLKFIDEEPRLVRPANFAEDAPGRGAQVVRTRRDVPVLVANVVGRVFMDPVRCPFRALDHILDETPEVRLRFVDVHAEATSEKIALGWYLDGRVTAVFGTHTHVPTADARVLPKGTAYITDAGMTGPHDSVIGVRKEAVFRRMVKGLPARFETASGDVRLSAVEVEADPETGLARSIQRYELPLEE